MHVMTHGWMGMGGFFGALVWLLLLALVVVAAVALVRALLPRTTPRPNGDGALEALRTRFARGEIDEAEYGRRRATLENQDQGARS